MTVRGREGGSQGLGQIDIHLYIHVYTYNTYAWIYAYILHAQGCAYKYINVSMIYLSIYVFIYLSIYLWVSVASAKKPFPIESMFDSWFNSSAWLAWVNIMVPNSPRWTERSSSDWNNKTMLRIINYDSWTGCMILEQWSTQRLKSKHSK